MNKKILLILPVLAAIAIVVGFWYLSENKPQATKDNQKKESNTDNIKTQEQYKKITVENGKGINFSFQVPKDWLSETKNAKGYEMMTHEEMKEFLATNYDGDIKANSQLTSDYTDLPWSMLEKMTIQEMKKVFENKKSKYNYNIGFPNVSVSSGKPINAIWYSDSNANQIDFYIIDSATAQNEIKNYKNDEFYKNNPNLIPTLTKENVGGLESYVLTSPPELDEKGNPVITKGASAGMTYFVMNIGNDKALVIQKQSLGDQEFENEFKYLIKTMIFG